jgi:hypothetical protein
MPTHGGGTAPPFAGANSKNASHRCFVTRPGLPNPKARESHFVTGMISACVGE